MNSQFVLARSQRGRCCARVKFGSAAQRENQPFVQSAARIRGRIFRSRTKPTLKIQPLLMQHLFTYAAGLLLKLNARHRTDRSRSSISAEPKKQFRCGLAVQAGSEINPPFALATIADAENDRNCSVSCLAAQWNRPLNDAAPGRFQWVLSLHPTAPSRARSCYFSGNSRLPELIQRHKDKICIRHFLRLFFEP